MAKKQEKSKKKTKKTQKIGSRGLVPDPNRRYDSLHEVKEALNSTKADEYLDQLQRLQAEFINFRTRAEKEKQDLIKYAKEELILKLLDVLDNFERAVQAMSQAKDVHTCKDGVQMILSQFKSILNQEGLEAIEAKGNKFDPYLHEAMAKEHSEEDENTIIDEFQRGYKLKEKVIRPSKVKVSGGKKNE